MKLYIIFILLFGVSIALRDGAKNSKKGKILLWMTLGSKSHWQAWKPMAYELAKRGHEITAFVPFEDKGLRKFENVELGK